MSKPRRYVRVERDQLRAELDRMSRELNAHLDFEEENLIPVLSRIPFPPPAPTE